MLLRDLEVTANHAGQLLDPVQGFGRFFFAPSSTGDGTNPSFLPFWLWIWTLPAVHLRDLFPLAYQPPDKELLRSLQLQLLKNWEILVAFLMAEVSLQSERQCSWTFGVLYSGYLPSSPQPVLSDQLDPWWLYCAFLGRPCLPQLCQRFFDWDGCEGVDLLTWASLLCQAQTLKR